MVLGYELGQRHQSQGTQTIWLSHAEINLLAELLGRDDNDIRDALDGDYPKGADWQLLVSAAADGSDPSSQDLSNSVAVDPLSLLTVRTLPGFLPATDLEPADSYKHGRPIDPSRYNRYTLS